MKSKLPFVLTALLLILIAGVCLSGQTELLPALGVVVTAGLSNKALLEKRGDALEKARSLLNTAKAQGRDLNTEERQAWEETMQDVETIDQARAEIQRTHERVAAEHGGTFFDPEKHKHLMLNAVPPEPGGNRQSAGRVLFRDADGRDIRAFGHNERMTAGEPLSVGKMLFAQLTGRTDTLTSHEIMNLGSGTGGEGYLLTPQYSQSIIDLARSASVVGRAGAMTVTMENEQLKLIKLLTDPTAHWRHPGNTIEASNMTFSMLTLTARTLAVIVPVYIEWLEDARNGAQIIEQAITNAMALKLDQAALYGLGAAAEPRGILNEPLINEVATVGLPTDYTELSQAIGDILNANYPGDISSLAWVKHPRDGETYDNLLDADNNPLRMTPWVEKLRPFHTTSLPTTDGGGANESSMIIGDFSQVIFGLRKRMVIQSFPAGNVTDADGVAHNAVSEMKYLIRAYLRADVGVLRPTWLTKLTGVTAA